jgi:pimeloyl-ACP methyl ester carboxylesterase
MRTARSLLLLTLAAISLASALAPAPAVASSTGKLEVIGLDDSALGRITDGDTVRLRLTLVEPSGISLPLEFSLGSDGPLVATCAIAAQATACETEPFATLGWYWSGASASGGLTVLARAAGAADILGEATLAIAPRPVVMVHGFSATWEAWANYLGPTGYLAQTGIAGFAVGDGQVPGTMNTGNFAEPARRTNTIAENAAILGEYIAHVKQATGAQVVDLIAHSMGGLISRAYIDRVMTTRDVAQLMMLGSPMAGTDCADLPASLGLYLPATLEIRPSYVRDIFNAQINHRRGVPYHALAGVPILESFKSPCTDVPSDLAVSLSSVTAIPVHASQMPVLHTELNISAQVYDEYVKPLLQTPAGGFADEPDPKAAATAAESQQFSRMFTGHVDAGASAEMTIPIDPGIRVASFALYDTSRSLKVSVTGASGNTIDLSTEKNGLVIVQDPEALIYLGYGFQDPKPGVWRVRLEGSATTPPEGADFALTARFVGGAQLVTRLGTLLPSTGEALALTAGLQLGSEELPLREAVAIIRHPDGTSEKLALAVNGSQAKVSLRPGLAGLYGVDIMASGTAPDGMLIERSAFLAFEAQPEVTRGLPQSVWAGALIVVVLVVGVALVVIRRRSGRV